MNAQSETAGTRVPARRGRWPAHLLVGGAVIVAVGGLLVVSAGDVLRGATPLNVAPVMFDPGERRRLQDDPGLIESAGEEFLRYDSPVQITDRIATEDSEVAGVPM